MVAQLMRQVIAMGKVKEYLYDKYGEEGMAYVGDNMTDQMRCPDVDKLSVSDRTIAMLPKGYEVAKTIHNYETTNKKKLTIEEVRTLIDKFDD